MSSFAGTFLRCRWWITSVDDHVGHNNVVPERMPVPSRTTIPQDATKSGSGQRPGSDTDSYESGGGGGGCALPCLSMNDAPAAKKSATNIGEITFGGPIFNVVSLNYLGKRHKKTFFKSLGGGMAPVAMPLSLAMRKGFR